MTTRSSWLDQLWERHFQKPKLSRTVEITLGITAHDVFDVDADAYRFYDDGTESGSTPKAAENTAITVTVDTDQQVHLRYRVQEVGAGSGAGASTDDYGLEFAVDGGAFNPVTTTSSRVQVDTASSLTDDAATTNRATNGISDGTGSFFAGIQEEGDGIITDFQHQADNFTEHVFALKLIAADVSDGEVITFRLTLNGGAPGMTNSVTPQITIDVSPPPPPAWLPRMTFLPVQSLRAHRASPVVFERYLPPTFPPPPPPPTFAAALVVRHPQFLRARRTSAALLDLPPPLFIVTAQDIMRPTPVFATFAIAAPSMVVGGVTMNPGVASATFVIPAQAMDIAAINLTPGVASATFVTPTVAMDVAPLSLTPGVAFATFDIAAPAAALGDINLQPGQTWATFAIAAPSISSGVTMTPGVASALFVTPAPAGMNLAALNLTPGVASSLFSVPAPALQIGDITFTAGVAFGTFFIPAPTMPSDTPEAPLLALYFRYHTPY